MLPQNAKIDFISFTNAYGGRLRVRLDSITEYSIGKPNSDTGRVNLSIRLVGSKEITSHTMRNKEDGEKLLTVLDDYFNFIN